MNDRQVNSDPNIPDTATERVPELVPSRTAGTAGAKDLSEELTVFVTTIGDEPNFTECIACLERQSVRFRLSVIKNVAPMSAAFNQMIERCHTRWFVQVDEDMLLFPGSIQYLYDRMIEARGDVGAIGAPLWDCQIARPIFCVKIFRHAAMQALQFRDTTGCDLDLFQQMVASGYRLVELPLRWSREDCLGDHGKHYTPRTAYLRWKRQFQKRRELGKMEHILPWPKRFLDRYQETGSEVDLYSFLGAVAGMTSEETQHREFDFQAPLPDFDRLVETLRDVGLAKARGRELLERPREWRLRLKQWLWPEWKRPRI